MPDCLSPFDKKKVRGKTRPSTMMSMAYNPIRLPTSVALNERQKLDWADVASDER